MKLWECNIPYEVEKPWTDSEYGCQFWTLPYGIVEAETRGQARAKYFEFMHYGWEYYEVEFIDVRVRLWRGENPPSEKDLEHMVYIADHACNSERDRVK